MSAVDEPARHPLDYLPAGTLALDRYRRVWQRVDDAIPGSDHLARRWLALQPGPAVTLDSVDLEADLGPVRVLHEPDDLPCDDVTDWAADPRRLRYEPGASVPLAQAHAAFLAWAAQVGVPPVPQRRFSVALTSRGVTRTQYGPGRASILHDITLPTPRARTSTPGGHHHDNMKGTSS